MTRYILIALSIAMIGGPLFAEGLRDQITECRETPTAVCLADIGFALSMDRPTLDVEAGVVDYLGQMGRVDEAEVLAKRIAMLEGHVGARAEQMVGLRVGRYRIIEALMQGADLATVKEGPQGFLTFAALSQMAGVMRSGSFQEVSRTVDPDRLAVVRSALADTTGKRFDRLAAAELLASIGDDRAALALLRDLPVDASPRTNVSPRLIALLGPERVHEIYRGMERISVWWFSDLAKGSETPEQARAYLDEMFALAKQADTPRGRAFDLRWVIRTAKALGETGIANEAMVLQRSEIDPVGPEMRALVSSHLDYGSPEDEVRAVLRQAEKRLWDLEDDTARVNALATLAPAYAQLGDARRAARLLERGEADVSAWATLILADMTADTRAVLLKRAERHWKRNNSDVLVRVTAGLARPERPQEDRDWARRTAWALLEADPPDGTYEAGYFYDRLLNAALRLDAPDLRDAVLRQSAETALDHVAPVPILQAAYQHYRLSHQD
ncbi:MAG: hypothetical protein AAF222_12230 [Pseudomonadota bacterium]